MSEFKNLPSGWSKCELGEICKISSSKFDPTKSNEVKKCIELEHLSQKTGQILGFISSGEQKSIKNEFKKGQILYGKLRPYLQKFCQAKFDGVCSSEIWVLQGKKVTNDFLFYLVQSDKFNQIANKTSGTKMPRADWEYMSEMPFFIPPELEQKKIAKILSTWDEAINLTINLIESKKQFKKAIMQNLLTAKIRFPEFKDEWQETKLGKILKERKAYQNKGFDMEHVSLTKDGVVPKSERYDRDFLVKDDNKQYKITRLNDICYNPANLKFGVICKNIYGDGIFSPIYVTFECCNELDNDFAGFYLTQNDFIQKVRKFEEGTVYERMAVSPEDFLRFKIKLPNLNEQQKIAEVLMACDDEINLLNLKLENLKKQKQGLMQKLLIGETRTCYVKKAM
ncbi:MULTISPECIES: restriction endonuclease subunit S [Campylobacter]|uniref:restriction endonuclease subunit S n=1 Tax=Campylobacter TaxID=194 RepID=UPI000D2F7BA5|nr:MULTISPECIES: restriction endonuclease subunit S [Campylobacter]